MLTLTKRFLKFMRKKLKLNVPYLENSWWLSSLLRNRNRSLLRENSVYGILRLIFTASSIFTKLCFWYWKSIGKYRTGIYSLITCSNCSSPQPWVIIEGLKLYSVRSLVRVIVVGSLFDIRFLIWEGWMVGAIFKIFKNSFNNFKRGCPRKKKKKIRQGFAHAIMSCNNFSCIALF